MQGSVNIKAMLRGKFDFCCCLTISGDNHLEIYIVCCLRGGQLVFLSTISKSDLLKCSKLKSAQHTKTFSKIHLHQSFYKLDGGFDCYTTPVCKIERNRFAFTVFFRPILDSLILIPAK